ncbi:hypothetical protein AJ79_06106 [Helicocarpus griseus UAMH5409]|uniref:Uncharacterized protein n=1 Tax=Helicocarpus griseus UAMH5409 TaxID=1447875 RepID=A0A2B7XG38_9EURO|nr:hypothetical protein AJ79_06106 [Helicocarpus griseus UAMH5409]
MANVQCSATRLLPPFSIKQSLSDLANTSRPVAVRSDSQILLCAIEPTRYLVSELKTPRLDRIHEHLWLAGLPRPARPLHRQKLMNRTILITENPDEHLVWRESEIFIKPLPEFLLSYESWETELSQDEELHQCACGLLLSYSWLICHKSDFRIAKEVGLIPAEIEWAQWNSFVGEFLSNINSQTLQQVSKRYRYGELRLSRLHSLYRFTPSVFSIDNLVRGYMSGSTWYRVFFKRNFAWLLAVFVYVTVILSAFQVGLATEKLERNRHFHNASYGFAVMSIVIVVLSILAIFTVWIVLFWYHLYSTRKYVTKVEVMRQKLAISEG